MLFRARSSSSMRVSCMALGVVVATIVLSMTACKSRDANQSEVQSGAFSSASTSSGLNLCAGVRGNGNYIFTHFGALSRIVEDYGEVNAMAGGSSASITAFLYESILQNDSLTQASGQARNDEIALLVKSLMGHLDGAFQTEQLNTIVELVKAAQAISADPSLQNITKPETAQAVIKLNKALGDPTIRSIINPVVLAMLANQDGKLANGQPDPNYVPYVNQNYKVQEVVKAAKVVGSFSADNPTVFFREGILSYEGLARLMGGIANFYAGNDVIAAPELAKFIGACAAVSHGKTWDEVKATTTAQGTCGDIFTNALKSYWPRWEKNTLQFAAGKIDRLEQPLGKTMPAFVPSAYLNGAAAITTYQAQLANYRNALPVTLDDIKFDDVKFGYFVPSDREALLSNKLKSDSAFNSDPKIQKIEMLNGGAPVLWKNVLQLSPLEPGLGRIKVVNSTRAYIGGWADLHPTQILHAAGCQNVIYLTRQGPETAFVSKNRSLNGVAVNERVGIAELLNMDAALQERLYLGNNSSYNQAVGSSEAVWCTDWDTAEAKDTKFMFDHSYGKTPSKNGFMTQIALNNAKGAAFFNKPGVPRLQSKLLGCTAP